MFNRFLSPFRCTNLLNACFFTKLVVCTPFYSRGNWSLKSLGDITSTYHSWNLFSVPPALSLLFFQLHHCFSNFPSEVLHKAGTMRTRVCWKSGQAARRSPENTTFLWNLLFYMRHESGRFCCFHMHMQVKKLLKVHTFKTFSPLVKFDVQVALNSPSDTQCPPTGPRKPWEGTDTLPNHILADVV